MVAADWVALGDALAACADAGLWPVVTDEGVRVRPLGPNATARRLDPTSSWVPLLRSRRAEVSRMLRGVEYGLLDELRTMDPEAWEWWAERSAICAEGCKWPTAVANVVAFCWTVGRLRQSTLVSVMPVGTLELRAA